MLAPQEECFSNIVQDFLICTTVHKARQIGTFQSAVYVRITLDKMVRHTHSYDNSENPFFNQYFVFEVKCTLVELMRLTILYEMKKRTICKKNPSLGELVIDMQSVWNQPNRCYFKKWGRLETPIGQMATAEGGGSEGRGFIQIDLAIVSQASNPHTLLRPSEEDFMILNKWQMHTDYDDIEKNLLENIDTGVRCNIRYTVMFYRAIMSKKSDYMLQFRFHPFKGKTNIIKNTAEPCFNQEMSFVWTYPSLSQSFGIQVMMHEHLQWKCVSEYEVHFNEIAFHDKPALGPTFIHFYDNLDSSNYIGRLLFQIKSERLDTELNHVMTVKEITPLDEKQYWHEEHFLIEFMAVQGDFVHSNSSNCKISIKMAEHNSNYLELFIKNYVPTAKKCWPIKSAKCFLQQTPFKAITLRVYLPDNRTKFESDVHLQEIWDFIRTELECFKLFQIYYAGHKQTQLKVLRNVLLRVVAKIEQAIENNRLDHNSSKEATKWDLNRMVYLKEYFNKILKDLHEMRLKLKCFKDPYFDLVFDEVLVDLIQCSNQLQHLMSRTLAQDEWPDLVLVLQSGGKEVGLCRLNAKNFFYPGREREANYNSHCWQLKNFIFKDIKCQHTCINCGCTVGLVRGCLSIVAESENSEFTRFISPYWQHPETFYWYPHNVLTFFKGRLFIHQAKIRPGADRTGLCDPYVRVMLYQNSAETAVILSSLSPIWNTVISFDNLQMPGEFEWYRKHPPLAAIEVYDTDKRTADDFLGCGVLPLTVVKSENTNKAMGDWDHVERPKHALEKYEFLKWTTPPPLKWIPIAYRGAIRAEVLMSGELVQVADAGTKEFTENVESRASVTVGIPTAIKPIMKNFVLEAVFAGFRNYQKQHFVMGKHRVKLMMADLVLTSGLSTSPINNSMNFLVLYAAGVVSLPEQLEYWPAIIATDVVVASKGSESTLGATLIANSKRYLQNEKRIPCIPLDEEEEYEDEDVPSTTVQIDEDDDITDSESHPLLPPKDRPSYFKVIFRNLKLPRKRSRKTEEMYDLKDIIDENDYNWWTKFYNSGHVEPCSPLSTFKHKLCIYSSELEKQPEFSYLNDWAEPVHMVHGVKYKKNAMPHEEIYATLKIHLKITRCMCKRLEAGRKPGGGDTSEHQNTLKPLATALNPRYQTQLQSLADLVKVVARVYVVQGIQLRPSGKNIQADSYVTVQLGQKQVTNRAEHVCNDSNPIFGKCFQVDGLLPREHLLEVAIFNRRDIKDDIIGSTIIDLEDRWRSKHRATVGIANEFSSYGYNRWHDNVLPLEILEDLCKSNDIRPPKFMENSIEVDGVRFEDETQIATDEDLQQRLSLTVLKNLENLPSFGYKLVPQHVETRSLYRNECPGIEQGKIQLWIELYDANLNIPPPIDIMPLPPQLYELRVIIYNVSEVVLNEKNIFGTAMSDIYLKGWCSSYEDAQSTDIHYRSLNGEGNFNWRMLFPLKYSSHEDMVVTKHHPGFMEEYEQKQPPILNLQIWDIDFLSADDFLGSLEINLSGFPEPFPTAKKCQLSDITYSESATGLISKIKKAQSSRKLINLFKEKHVRGWYPMRGNTNNTAKQSQSNLAGKVELEMEVLTIEEAKADPVGLGREGPKPLPEPKRPKSSFNPLKNPWKGMKRIVFPKVLKLVVIIAAVVLLGMVLFHFMTRLPDTMMGWDY